MKDDKLKVSIKIAGLHYRITLISRTVVGKDVGSSVRRNMRVT